MKQFTFNEKYLKIFAAKIREIEREECVKLIENLTLAYPKSGKKTASQCANAIRLRSVSPESYLMLKKEPAHMEGIWDKQEIK